MLRQRMMQAATGLLVSALIGLAPAQAQLVQDEVPERVPQKFIQNVQYNPHSGELIISSENNMPLTPKDVTHNARRQQIEFYLPSAVIQPSPNQVNVDKDPLVKAIKFEQRAVNTIPAVKVTVELYSKSPYLPFSVIPEAPGLKMVIGHSAEESANEAPQVVTLAKPTGPNPAKEKPPEIALRGDDAIQPVAPKAPAFEGTSFMALEQSTSMNHGPQSAPIQPRFDSAPPASRPAPMATRPMGPAPGQTDVTAAAAPPPPANLATIDDIYYDNNELHVVSGNKPIQVERTFQLGEPDRYVVDIKPAVLSPQTAGRAILENNPNITSFRIGQFDDQTVRVVVQFNNGQYPVDVTQQGSNNRHLKLAF